MDKQIIRIDASSLKNSSCGRRFYLDVVEGYAQGKCKHNMLYGSAFHKCVEVYARTKGDQAAAHLAALTYWQKGLESKEYVIGDKFKYLNEGHLTLSCMKFFGEVGTNRIFTDNYPLVVGDEVLVEKKFSIPIFSNPEVDVLLQGTLDSIVQIRGGCPCVGDWKTTCTSKTPIEFFQEFKLSVQLRTYVWALKWICNKAPESELARLLAPYGKIGAFIFGGFMSAGKGIDFLRSEVYQFSAADLAEYELLLMATVESLLTNNTLMKEFGTYPAPTGIMNGSCGFCKYFNTCSAAVGVTGDRNAILKGMLNNNFTRRAYQPLNFGGGPE